MLGDRRMAVTAQLAWAAAAAALARGDREAFARQAREAALYVAAGGDIAGSAVLTEIRAGVLATPPPAGSAVDSLAAALRRGPVAEGLDLWWRYLRAVVVSLPDAHPLLEVAVEDGWDVVDFDVMVAALGAGPGGATREALAAWTGHSHATVAVHASADGVLQSSGAVGELDGRLVPNPALWAVCVGAPSPFEVELVPSLVEDHGLPPWAAQGVRVVIGPSVPVAITAALHTPPRPLQAPAGEAALIWAARDARWRGRAVLLDLAAPTATHARLLVEAPRVCVVAAEADLVAAWLVMHLGTLRAVDVCVVPPLPPAASAARLAAALGTRPEQLRVGWLFPDDLDTLVAAVGARGDDAGWALAKVQAEHVRAELGIPAVSAPPVSAGEATAAPTWAGVSGPVSTRGLAAAHDRARELLGGIDAWSPPATALLAEPELAVGLAAALADDRGAAWTVVSMTRPDAWAAIIRAVATMRRYDGVLALVDVASASPVLVAAAAPAVLRSAVTTVIGFPAAVSPPAALRRVSRV